MFLFKLCKAKKIKVKPPSCWPHVKWLDYFYSRTLWISQIQSAVLQNANVFSWINFKIKIYIYINPLSLLVLSPLFLFLSFLNFFITMLRYRFCFVSLFCFTDCCNLHLFCHFSFFTIKRKLKYVGEISLLTFEN